MEDGMKKEKIETAKKRRSLPVRIIKIVAIVLAAVLLIAAAYLAYVFISYHRIGDTELTPVGEGSAQKITCGKDEVHSIVSFNVGFGAYEPDYGFFMDGGTESWAWSEERLDKNLSAAASFLGKQNAEIELIQEVDFDSTRSYHLDEREYFISVLSPNGEESCVFAQNYDST